MYIENSFDKISIMKNKEYLKKETEKRIGKIIEKRALKKDVELTASVKI
mgnify:CR=1 FL=1